MADANSTPLAAGLDTSPAHRDADLIALAQLGDQAEEEWAAAPEDSEARADAEDTLGCCHQGAGAGRRAGRHRHQRLGARRARLNSG